MNGRLRSWHTYAPEGCRSSELRLHLVVLVHGALRSLLFKG